MLPPSPPPRFVYKILSAAPPNPLPPALPLSPLDAKHGFIHLATAAQVRATASRFYANEDELWLLKLHLGKLEEGEGEVRWEEISNRGWFAQLHGTGIGQEEVEEVMAMRREDGSWEEVLGGLEE